MRRPDIALPRASSWALAFTTLDDDGSSVSRGPSHSLRFTYWNRALASGPVTRSTFESNLLFSVLPPGALNTGPSHKGPLELYPSPDLA